MFARLTGTVEYFGDSAVVLDVNGVGYLVACSARTRAQLQPGQVARLFIETHVREDAINLYGFADTGEQAWFKLLTTVQGVGAKVGMAILSTLSPSEMATAIAAQDKAMFTRADGVGPKLGVRIVTELKDKIPESFMTFATGNIAAIKPKGGVRPSNAGDEMVTGGSIDADAISGLVNLGYNRAEAFAAVMKVKSVAGDAAYNLNVGDIIRLALGELARNVA